MDEMDRSRQIRNFCIIAHIDHGKSTLADRFIERAKLIPDRNMQAQLLDSMDIERERGITIKSQAVTLPFTAQDGEEYILNLVDTPGHVDFSYEVSRAISSCEGAILLIDATQGVEAQTLANLYLAMEQDLEILPVINKVDLPSADVDMVRHQIDRDLGLDSDSAILVSAKTGEGLEQLLEAIVATIPPPVGRRDEPLQGLIFDSHYDPYRGVVVHLRIFNGHIATGDRIRFIHSKASFKVEEVGTFCIDLIRGDRLEPGEVGYLIAGIKEISTVRVGDTVTQEENPAEGPLEGFREAKPVVFSSIYPVNADDYVELSRGMDRLKLSDASINYEKDSSVALGFGFRCGFLGLLHLEVVQERLEREVGLSIVLTSPSVKYKITLKSGESIWLDNPTEFPDPSQVEQAEEPYIRGTILTPDGYLGGIINLCLEHRGNQVSITYLDEKRVELIYEMPLAEVLFDFYDRLKSVSRGYASFDYDVIEYRATELVKLDILINGAPVDALTQLIHKEGVEARARRICKQLQKEIPRHQFKIPIQGAIGGTIVARETISALRKDVTAKCYGGDITRKRKLLEKQKAGKKRMKMVGNVELPQTAFLSVLRSSQE